METKHTKGPWKLITYRPDDGIESASGDRIVSQVGPFFDGKRWAEARANGLLIAAAPDLLAELENIVEQYDAWRDLGDAAAEPPDMEGAHALLARVRGSAVTL